MIEAGTPAERRFRPEIEGLRAVAAVLVAVYHVFLGRVSGGVDVFFVIAGFLITTSLLGRATDGGGVRPGSYLARLAVRLLPIAVVVLVAVAAASVAWMPVTRQLPALQEIAASALYVENWTLALKAVDYVARDEAKSPVQHFWAMSVQGQFYLAWLVLFAVIGGVARGPRFRATLLAILGFLFAASLALSILLTASDQPFAYFHTGARIWEFAAGGLLAVAAPRLAILGGRLGGARGPLGLAAGWLGLAMIVSCGLLLRVSSQFPGVAALWPITGAVLVIVAAGAGGRWSAGRLLASAPLVFVGGVAYALYLWHWPVLVFARIWLGREGPVDLAPGAAVIVASFVLAVVTTRVVERPIRLRLADGARPWTIAGAGAAILVTIATTTLALGGPAPAPVSEVAPDPVTHPGAAALGPRPSASPTPGAVPGATDAPPPEDDDTWDEEWWTSDSEEPPAATIPPSRTQDPHRAPVEFVPDLLSAKNDMNSLYPAKCQLGGSKPGMVICERGDPKGRVTAMLVGGSHATQWYPPLNRIARDRGWKLLTALKGSCRFLSGPYGEDSDGRSCKVWVAELLEIIRDDPPDFIITTSTVTNPRGELVPRGYLDVWRELDRLDIPVVGIRDTPRAPFNRVDCLAVHERDPEACDIPRSPTMDAEYPALRRSGIPDNVILVDVTDYICTPDTCPAVVGNVVVYRDSNHLTATYAMTLAPMLAEQIPLDPVAVHRAAEAAASR